MKINLAVVRPGVLAPNLEVLRASPDRFVGGHGVEPPTPAFSELGFPVFPTTSRVAVGLPNTGKYDEDERTVGDCRG